MSGSVGFEKDRGRWCIHWWWNGKKYKFRKVDGEWFWSKAHALKVLSIMQGEVDRGVFRISAYTGPNLTDTVNYLDEWLEGQSLMPATYKTYRAAVRIHLIPYFTENKVKLHEIQLDTVTKLLRDLQAKGLSPKYIWNIINTLHACLSFAYRSNRIKRMPSFPRKGEYKLQKKTPEWLPEDQQIAIINAIDIEHQPIFWWLKYHYRRPAEAYALNREDYDVNTDCFIIRRSVSARKVVERTKTGAVHIQPVDENFRPFLELCRRRAGGLPFISPAFFSCKTARNSEKRYTDSIAHRLWYAACDKVGIKRIWLYRGTKHTSCTNFLLKGGTEQELQLLTDHANIASVKPYTGAILDRKRAAMSRGKLIELRGQDGAKDAANH